MCRQARRTKLGLWLACGKPASLAKGWQEKLFLTVAGVNALQRDDERCALERRHIVMRLAAALRITRGCGGVVAR